MTTADRLHGRRLVIVADGALQYIPFADHNAIQDPSCPDITGRTLECLGAHGYLPDHPAVQRGMEIPAG